MVSEFEEIGHSGGRITLSIKTDDKGGLRSYQMAYSSSRPVPRVPHCGIRLASRYTRRGDPTRRDRAGVEPCAFPRLFSSIH